MGHLLYAIVVKKAGGIDYRIPTVDDQKAVERAEVDFKNKQSEWALKNLLPTEEIGISNYDRGHRLYGIQSWAEFFSIRQLLAAGTFLETLNELYLEMKSKIPEERAKSICLYLSIALDKAVIYNSLQSRFNPERGIRSVFDRHNYAFTWNYAEFDAALNLLPWVLSQIDDAYTELTKYSSSTQSSFIISDARATNLVSLSNRSASSLTHIADNCITNITVDPPYYDSIQYSELSDFFYVWLKRSVGNLFPEYFVDDLTNKDDEAVANPARFDGLGKKKALFAKQDYERKIGAAFCEMHRVLHPDGCLTVMFTHKKVEAWDTLAMALIEAGFVIRASWPVHTESEHIKW